MDENTQKHCYTVLSQKINDATTWMSLVIPAGEKHKTIESSLQLWEALSIKGADRNSLLINLGGGVITDLGGFVAATFKRGIGFINIPTSLLGMVDAAIGGKTGVDLRNLKNQIGTITNPEMIVVDGKFLETLPQNHLISGFAEMLKHGMIYSRPYWNKLKDIDFQNLSTLENLIWESIEIKNEVVKDDPFELDRRKILNYGHTLGHAIESYFLRNKENPLLHGEAIAIGLVLETYLSHHLAGFPWVDLKEVSSVVKDFYPKIVFTEADIEEIMKLLSFDKKNRNGKVLFVLLEGFGKPRTDYIIDNKLIIRAFKYYQKM